MLLLIYPWGSHVGDGTVGLKDGCIIDLIHIVLVPWIRCRAGKLVCSCQMLDRPSWRQPWCRPVSNYLARFQVKEKVWIICTSRGRFRQRYCVEVCWVCCPGSVKWVPAYMDWFEAAATCAYICFWSAGGKLIIVKRLSACYMKKALYKCITLLYFWWKQVGWGKNRVKEVIKNVCLLHTILYEFSAIPEKTRLLVYFCWRFYKRAEAFRIVK